LDLADAERILAGTPDTLDALFRQAPEDWTRHNEGGESWSPFDILAHLLLGETVDWFSRARRILREGVALRDPVDGLEEAQSEISKGNLAEFREAREANLRELRNLRLEAKDLETEGKHPALGTVTLGQLLATWVVHDLGHVAQICRTLSAQYKEVVGPWGEYLPILHRRRDPD